MVNTITVGTSSVFNRRAEKLRLFEESPALRQKEKVPVNRFDDFFKNTIKKDSNLKPGSHNQ